MNNDIIELRKSIDSLNSRFAILEKENIELRKEKEDLKNNLQEQTDAITSMSQISVIQKAKNVPIDDDAILFSNIGM